MKLRQSVMISILFLIYLSLSLSYFVTMSALNRSLPAASVVSVATSSRESEQRRRGGCVLIVRVRKKGRKKRRSRRR